MRVRIYTAGSLGIDDPGCLMVRSPALPLPGGRRVFTPNVLRFLRRLRSDRVNVIHVTDRGPVGLAGALLARHLRLPLIGSVHGDGELLTATSSSSPADLSRLCHRWPYARCQRLLVPSEHARHLLVSRGADPVRVSVWGHGVDASVFTPARRSHSLRQSWGLETDRHAILCVGRLSADRGLQVLPQVRDRLHLLGVHHRFVFVGHGPMRRQLEAWLPDAVFADLSSPSVLAETLACGDVLVSTSRGESGAGIVLDAQASGVPVVVAGTGAPREQMIAGLTGMVCHSEQPEEWASAIAAILRRPERLAAMRAAARTHALTRPWMHALQPLYHAYLAVAAVAQPSAVLPLPRPA